METKKREETIAKLSLRGIEAKYGWWDSTKFTDGREARFTTRPKWAENEGTVCIKGWRVRPVNCTLKGGDNGGWWTGRGKTIKEALADMKRILEEQDTM